MIFCMKKKIKHVKWNIFIWLSVSKDYIIRGKIYIYFSRTLFYVNLKNLFEVMLISYIIMLFVLNVWLIFLCGIIPSSRLYHEFWGIQYFILFTNFRRFNYALRFADILCILHYKNDNWRTIIFIRGWGSQFKWIANE